MPREKQHYEVTDVTLAGEHGSGKSAHELEREVAGLRLAFRRMSPPACSSAASSTTTRRVEEAAAAASPVNLRRLFAISSKMASS
jgi:hypothetical protein